MTLPNGTITMNQVNVELGNPGTSQISLNDTDVRNLAFGVFTPTAPTYVGGTSQENSSSDLTLTGLQPGDLVLFFSAAGGAANARNTPSSGWTAIPGLGTQPDNNNFPDSAVFYKFSTGTSITASNLNDNNRNGTGVHVMIAFRGVNPQNPFNVNSVESTGNALPNPPSITTTDDNCMIVAVGLLKGQISSVAAPSGYTLAEAETEAETSSSVMTAYKVQTSAGSEDPGIFGGSGSNNYYKAQTIALEGILSGPTAPTPTTLSGGTSYAPGDGYTYFVFTSSGTFASTDSSLNTTAEVIAVGGGGGGGGGSQVPSDGGGGGAGGYLRQPVPLSNTFSVPFVIGSGGAGGLSSPIAFQGGDGTNTTLALPSGTITAGYGGGGGGAFSPNDSADAGRDAPLGSGGGAANRQSGKRGSNTIGTGGPQGNPGGYNDPGPLQAAGGGGGAGSAGRNSNNPSPSSTLSDGGAGISVSPLPYNNLPGSVRKDFAGGGGGARGGAANPIGGGGNGAPPGGGNGVDAVLNSGGGGGGGHQGDGGDGTPGIIIMRVSTSDIPPAPATPTISMDDLRGKSADLPVLPFSLSGGSSWTAGGYTYRAYTSTTPATVTGSGTVDALIVAGGGQSRSAIIEGGGGAGGFRVVSFPVSSPLIATVGGSESDSNIGSYTSRRGGNSPAGPGGSGAGRQYRFPTDQGSGGTGNDPPVSPPQGNPGGARGPYRAAGGGGGAGNAGSDGGPLFSGGPGGNGTTVPGWTIPSSYGTPGPTPARYFAGGGGAATYPSSNPLKPGGYGGGGTGGRYPGTSGTNGTTNTGGGAGGNANTPIVSGGSGIIIVRYTS